MHLVHRGIVSKNYRENILKSFNASFKKGYGIETDIHSTKDEKFVCFHDRTLKRFFGKNKSIKDTNYQELKKISKKGKGEIPLLKHLLKLSKKKFYLFIEIKPVFSIKLIKKLLLETKAYKKCVFISFKEKNIYNIIKLNPKIKVGLSFSYNTKVKIITKKAKNKYINYLILDKYFLNNKMIKNIQKDKYFYTIKKKNDFLKLKNDNNLIFENL
tara:strand:+ start:506 stop:1147 length:642 start_codon:yes stop_codon:yes gene_type:complete